MSTRSGLYALWREWRVLLACVLVLLVFRSAVADLNRIPSASMRPNLVEGDRIEVDKLAYDLRVPFTLIRIHAWADPHRGDVVTFASPIDDRLLVKRAIGLPGDVVELRNNRLLINHTAASYEALPGDSATTARLPAQDRRDCELLREQIAGTDHLMMLCPRQQYVVPGYASFGPVTVPPGQYLMLGDNRDTSADYRRIGFVDRARVLGRADHIAFSLGDDWLPRRDRFLIALQ